MAQRWIEAVVSARFLVACLGETASPAWWRSEATDATSRRLLERLYPRTFLVASLDTASRAAALEHDNHLGRIGTYHLFRLPAGTESALHELLAGETGMALLRQLASLEHPEQRLARLDEVAGQSEVTSARGPLRCGSVDDLPSGRVLQRMCAAYAHAFRDGTPVYPYVDREAQR